MAAGLTSYRASRLLTPATELSPGVVTVDGEGRVAALSKKAPGGWPVVELGQCTIVPGFVDLHLHGGAGAGVNGGVEEEVAADLARVCAFHASHGTTSLLATTVSDRHERLVATLRAIGRAERPAGGARLLGAHLEGPFLAAARRGAQPERALRSPSLEELEELSEAAAGSLVLVTLAPELPGALEAIRWGERQGVIFGLGHSEADYETAVAAFDAGARHVVHLFNAMAPLHHRSPGLVGAALTRPEVTFELVADLEHLHPAVVRLAAALGPERAVAVTDATSLAGAEGSPEALLGGARLRLSGRRVELAAEPGTLAGSVLTMDRALRNLVEVVGLGLEEALYLVTSNPGRLVSSRGVPYGSLEVGGPADMVVLDTDLSVAATFVGGEPVHDRDGLAGAGPSGTERSGGSPRAG